MLENGVLVIIGLVLLMFWYYHSLYDYWTKRGVPGPKPVPVVGNILDGVLRIKNIGMVYHDLYRKYSDHEAVGFHEFNSPKLMVRSPELIKLVLISDFSSFHDNEIYTNEKNDPYLELDPFVQRGEKWKPARVALISGLTTNKMKEIYLLMKQSIPHLDNYIDKHEGKDIEAKDFSNLFVMTNVSNSVFGLVNNCFEDLHAPFRKMFDLLHNSYWKYWWQVLIIFYLQRIRDFLGYSFVPRKTAEFVKEVVSHVAETRIKSNTKRNDFFQYYLDRDRSDAENIQEIVNHGLMFFVAGMETASITASNTLYELALNPEVQEHLYQELQDAYKGKDELEYDTLINLPYLNKVVQESMRKYPIMYAYMKVCTNTTTLMIDGKNVQIDAGTNVLVPVYSIHNDPRYYPDPDVFDPERFSEENKLSRPENTYMPFGDGPRACPGKKFGLAQTKLFLANIVHKYKILSSDRTPAKLSYNNHAFLVVPSDEMWIRFERRK